MSMQPSPLRVLIVGGGLGGLCLAHGLRRAGIHVSVFERDRPHPDPLHTYRIHIDPSGSRALNACLPPQVWRVFQAHAAQPPRGVAFATHQLRELAFITMPEPGSDPVARSYPISRAGLRQLLLTGLEDAVTFDKRLVRFEQAPDGAVTAYFADGTHASGDVLVGADGATSVVRQQYLPHARVVNTGIAGMAGKLYLTDRTRDHLPPALLSQMTLVLPPRDTGMFLAAFQRPTTSPDADIDLPEHIFWALLGRPQPLGLAGQARSQDGPALQRLALQAVDGWHPTLRRLVAESDPATLLSVPIHTSVPIPAWPTTRVTLLGDAVHTMTPLQGLGGNTALRDAALLCDHLVQVAHGGQDLLTAIHAYETAMREYGFEAVQRSLRIAEQVASPNAVGRMAFKLVLRVASKVPPLHQRLFPPRVDSLSA